LLFRSTWSQLQNYLSECNAVPLASNTLSRLIMKSFSLSKFLTPAAAIILSSCGLPQPRQVAFDESAFVRYGGSGSGSITGNATGAVWDETKTADHQDTVKLMPVTPYTDEIVQRVYANWERLEKSDPRLKKYVRKTHPDDKGHFEFHNLPAGDYYVSCSISGYFPSSSTDAAGNSVDTSDTENRWVYQRVSVGSGQTVNVSQWKEKN